MRVRGTCTTRTVDRHVSRYTSLKGILVAYYQLHIHALWPCSCTPTNRFVCTSVEKHAAQCSWGSVWQVLTYLCWNSPHYRAKWNSRDGGLVHACKMLQLNRNIPKRCATNTTAASVWALVSVACLYFYCHVYILPFQTIFVGAWQHASVSLSWHLGGWGQQSVHSGV
jgi:hypothetical protein